jgi:hypothetical protein
MREQLATRMRCIGLRRNLRTSRRPWRGCRPDFLTKSKSRKRIHLRKRRRSRVKRPR